MPNDDKQAVGEPLIVKPVSAPPVPEAATAPEPFERLKEVERKLATLEGDNKGFWGWVKKWSSVVVAYPVTFSFHKQDQMFELDFSVTLRNSGIADDVIKSSWARLIPPHGHRLDFDSRSITVAEKNVTVPAASLLPKTAHAICNVGSPRV
jgi:hypothetical protein